ncbi:MAG: tripartite tricarboxylate transporter substrate binding protein, partial [Comamonadaceae bacterium]|nr:tripartite tricarboxylate transporter substrate binding protein [Comamonadaceae bacterium]
MLMKQALKYVAAMIAAAAFGAPVLAQDYPSKPVTIVVGYAAGGGVDFVARLLAEKLADRLKQPVVVENRPSVGAVVASTFVSKAKPDGYTLMMGAPGPIIFNHALNDKLPYGPRDFAPISIMSNSPLVLLVSSSNPARNVQELVAQSRANPDKANYGASSASFQLATELFNRRTGAKFMHIPYKGANEAVQAVMAGDVTMTLADSGPAVTGLQSGRVKALAVTSAERLKDLPNVPTLAELGVDLKVSLWIGLLAPAGTPADIVKRLHEEMVRIVDMPDVRARIGAKASVPMTNTPEEFSRLIASEITLWRQVAQENN